MDQAPLGLLFSFLVALIIFSGFFSSSETAMMSLNRFRLKHLRDKNHRGARRASRLLRRPDRLIGLILIGNNLVNILAASIATVIAIRLYGDAGVVISSILLTLTILIFAEITPKTVAALHPEKVAFPASIVLLPLMRLMYPLVWLVNQITNNLLKMLGVDPSRQRDHAISSDELRTIVGEAGHHIPDQHQAMLLSILDLEQVTVNDIMIPRNEVFGVDLDETDNSILRRLQSSEYTRIPVYRDDINHIEGMLHLRHVSRVASQDGVERETLLDQMEKPYFVPEATPLNTQLLNFQKQKRRIAMVVDEYGDVMGLVTLEDILEEIVGEFTSNLADEIEDIYPQRDGAFLINGSANIRDINKELEWDLPTDGPKTLNGLMLEYLEAFPDGNTGLKIDDYFLEILELRGNVIQAVRAHEAPDRQRDNLN